jgi:ribonuclease D
MAELPRWVRTAGDVAALAARLRESPAVAIDTESDSLHHYPARLCLVQVGDAAGRVHLLDPLAGVDLSPLGPVLADPGIPKVLHAGDNDLAALWQRFGFRVRPLFDTYIAARFLGVAELGLDRLLERFLGVTLGASRQKDDWSIRPLSPAQEAYALDDVRHLIALGERLRATLQQVGREEWVREECEALTRLDFAIKADDPDAYLELKGARTLSPRSRAVLRELHGLRDALARTLDRPPFKVVGNEVLLGLATVRPRDVAALLAVRGITPRIVERFGQAILAAVERAEAIPEAELPELPKRSRPPLPGRVRRRIDALRAWRMGSAERLGLDPGVLLPGRLIERIAEVAPADVETLSRIEGLRRWRVAELGAEIVAVVSERGAGPVGGPLLRREAGARHP